MNQLVEVRAIARRQVLERVVRCLNDAGIPRFTVSKGHAVGAAIAADPAHFGEEGVAYRDVALVQCICARDRCAMITELIRRAAHTGQPGDGIVSVHPVLELTKILTGEAGLAALA